MGTYGRPPGAVRNLQWLKAKRNHRDQARIRLFRFDAHVLGPRSPVKTNYMFTRQENDTKKLWASH